MNLNTDVIYPIWDEINAFAASSSDEAIGHLMQRLSGHIGAANAASVIAVRLCDSEADPLRGWRPRLIRYTNIHSSHQANAEARLKQYEQGKGDITAIRFAVDAGSWRARRLSDLVEPASFESDYYKAHYLTRGYGDAIWAGCPINQDIELVFVFFRSVDHPRFGIAERDLEAAALRGLGVLFRQYVLAYGLSVARMPLTATERQVLKGLLDGQVEKQIASACQQSPHTMHDHVKHIFQKFGVNNRASLIALWLGRGLDR